MTLVRWRPLWDLPSTMDRFFDDFFNSLDGFMAFNGHWNPRVDIAEVDGEIIVTAELPGISKDDIKVTVQDHVLTLEGEKKQQKEEKSENYHRMERVYGAFCRLFELPAEVETDKIKANFKDGLLKIRLPKAGKDKSKEIKVEVK